MSKSLLEYNITSLLLHYITPHHITMTMYQVTSFDYSINLTTYDDMNNNTCSICGDVIDNNTTDAQQCDNCTQTINDAVGLMPPTDMELADWSFMLTEEDIEEMYANQCDELPF